MAETPTDKLDGYKPEPNEPRSDNPRHDAVFQAAVEEEVQRALSEGQIRFDNIDGYRNELTGIGTQELDKTLGGRSGVLEFVVRLLTGVDCENRWRGSDVGGRIVETIPAEMTREGWDLNIQSGDEEEEPDDRTDDFPTDMPAPTEKIRSTLEAPEGEGAQLSEQLLKEQSDLEAVNAFEEALDYERAFGGGAILLGVDDGVSDLTKPLDETKINRIKHLTAFRGGWDGELIAWRYYDDPRSPKYGMPEVYALRNLGVPVLGSPAPGENPAQVPAPVSGVMGNLIFYVHESRLLIFPGKAVSRRARVQMRGWGDSVFTRAEEVLSQYGQTWGSVANLMQDWATAVLKMDGLATLLTQPGNNNATGTVAKRMVAINLSKSIARTILIDKNEEYGRQVTALTGVSDVLQQFALRLAAAADMPVTLLMGQAPAGLNATGASDVRFFYDRVAARQRQILQPLVHRLTKLQMLAKQGPAKGVEPKKWSVEMRPLWQLTDMEQATLRKTQAETDQIYILQAVATPEEIAVSRFGGSKYSTDTVIDYKGREEMSKIQEDKAAKAAEENAKRMAQQPPGQAPGTTTGMPNGRPKPPPTPVPGPGRLE